MYNERWLSPGDDLTDAYTVRKIVFVDEQKFSPDTDIDDIDPTAHHIVYYDEAENPVACGRLFPDPEIDGRYIIGRVAVLKSLRKTGLGRIMMDALNTKALLLGGDETALGAQLQAKGFYENVGYTPYGKRYMEEHCEHIHMVKKL